MKCALRVFFLRCYQHWPGVLCIQRSCPFSICQGRDPKHGACRRPEDIKTDQDKDYNRLLDRDEVAMEGWLMKRNQRGVEWWKKRYFVLKVP